MKLLQAFAHYILVRLHILSMHNITCTVCSLHRYAMYTFKDPYLSFGVYITVQQLDYVYNFTTKKDEKIWTTVGKRRIGPLAKGQRIKNWKDTPEVDAVLYSN